MEEVCLMSCPSVCPYLNRPAARTRLARRPATGCDHGQARAALRSRPVLLRAHHQASRGVQRCTWVSQCSVLSGDGHSFLMVCCVALPPCAAGVAATTPRSSPTWCPSTSAARSTASTGRWRARWAPAARPSSAWRRSGCLALPGRWGPAARVKVRRRGGRGAGRRRPRCVAGSRLCIGPLLLLCFLLRTSALACT